MGLSMFAHDTGEKNFNNYYENEQKVKQLKFYDSTERSDFKYHLRQLFFLLIIDKKKTLMHISICTYGTFSSFY